MFDVPGRKRRATGEHDSRDLRVADIDSPTLASTLGRQFGSSLCRRPIEVQDASSLILDQ